jgi:RimJ/RimL family protein N-acetyltransferase
MAAMDQLRQHDITLRSGRTVLRPLREADWDLLLRWNSDPEVVYYSDDRDVTSYSLEEVQEIWRGVSRNAFCFIIEYDGVPIGEGWLQRMNMERLLDEFPGEDLRRIDLCIGEKEFWNRGIGSRVIGMLTEFGFRQENADAIFGLVSGHNPRSRRAFEKNGYALHRERPEEGPKSSVGWDLMVTKEAFLRAKKYIAEGGRR